MTACPRSGTPPSSDKNGVPITHPAGRGNERSAQAPLRVNVDSCFCGTRHQLLDSGLNLLSLAIFLPRLPVVGALPRGNHDIILGIIQGPKCFARDVALGRHRLRSQLSKQLGQLCGLPPLNLPIDNHPYGHRPHLLSLVASYQVFSKISRKKVEDRLACQLLGRPVVHRGRSAPPSRCTARVSKAGLYR